MPLSFFVSDLLNRDGHMGRYLLTAVASVLLLSSLYVHLLAREVESWPTTVGRLDSKGVVKYGAGSNGAAGGTDNNYAVYVRYTYQIGDSILHGTNVRVWDMTFNYRSSAERYLKDSNSGDTVQVFYNPAKPDQSYLDSAYPLAPVCFMLLGALVSGVASVFYQRIAKFFRDWSISRQS